MQNKRPIIAFFCHALIRIYFYQPIIRRYICWLILAAKKWGPYLLGEKFIVQTDQWRLKQLWKQKITTSPHKWLTKLMGFDFTIEYKEGKENYVADVLSRRHAEAVLGAISMPISSWPEPIINPNLQCLVKFYASREKPLNLANTRKVMVLKYARMLE